MSDAAPISTPTSTPESTPSEAAAVTEPTQAAPASGSSDKAEAPKPSKRQIKANGKIVEIDPADEEKYLSLGIASDEKFQSAAAERKQAEQLFIRMKSDPWGVMAELGINPREMSEEYLLKQLELEMMTPEQKEAHEIKQKLKGYEDKEAEAKKAAEEREAAEKEEKEKSEMDALTAKYQEEYTSQFLEAIEKTSLPKNYTTMRRTAEVLMQHRMTGKDISVAQALKIVEQDATSSLKEILGALDGDTLINYLGKETADKIRKYELSKLKNPEPQQHRVKETAQKAETSPKTPEEWLRQIRKEHGILR
jgi:hypothetical protein